MPLSATDRPPDKAVFSDSFRTLNAQFLGVLVDGFVKHSDGEYTLEEVRDHLRCRLHWHSPNNFHFLIPSELSMLNFLVS